MISLDEAADAQKKDTPRFSQSAKQNHQFSQSENLERIEGTFEKEDSSMRSLQVPADFCGGQWRSSAGHAWRRVWWASASLVVGGAGARARARVGGERQGAGVEGRSGCGSNCSGRTGWD